MKAPVILLVGASTLTEMKLRNLVPEAEWRVLPPGKRDVGKDVHGSVAVLFLDTDVEAGFRLLRELQSAGLRTVVVGATKDADQILRSMREGAREFVVGGDEEGLARAIREQLKPIGSNALGSVHAVFGAKGGVGATTVAVNVAGALRKRNQRVCLIDLNLNMGDVLAFLDLNGGYSVSDVVANMRRLDRELLDNTMLKHASGIHVLSQTHRVEDADRVSPDDLFAVLGFLRQHYDAIVIDGLRSFDDLGVAAVDAADQILLVLTQEVPAVRDARRCVDLFRRLGHDQKLKLVVNRFQRTIDITREVITETAGMPVAATVANDYPSVIRAIHKGMLLADENRSSAVARDIEGLLAVLATKGAHEAVRERRSIFSRFFASKVRHATE